VLQSSFNSRSNDLKTVFNLFSATDSMIHSITAGSHYLSIFCHIKTILYVISILRQKR